MSAARWDGDIEHPVAQYKAPLTARGYVLFVNIRPEKRSPQPWICDECFERVTLGQMERHAREHR